MNIFKSKSTGTLWIISHDRKLSGRQGNLMQGYICILKTLNRGGPQGSKLGPNIWNMVMDPTVVLGYGRTVRSEN